MPVAPGTQVQGDTASGTTEVAPVNPVKVGGVGNSSAPSAVTAGQRVAAWFGLSGNQMVTTLQGTSVADGESVRRGWDVSANGGNPAAGLLVYNGTNWDRQRTPAKFFTAQASASGSTTLWTPTSGKKFRLMRFKIDVPANCTLAARGVQVIKLFDSASDMNLATDVFLGQTAPVETASSAIPNFTTGWIDLGNGFLSAAANNVLNVNLGTALAAGSVRVTCCGTEE